MPQSEGKTRQINMRISHREHGALMRYAKEEGTTVTNLFRGYAQSLVRQQAENDRSKENRASS